MGTWTTWKQDEHTQPMFPVQSVSEPCPCRSTCRRKKNHCHQISVKKMAFAIMLLHDEWYAPKMQWLLSTNVSCSWIAAPLRFLKITKETGNRGRPLFEAVGVQSSRGWKMVSFPSCKDYLSRAACFFENYEPSLSFKCQNVFFGGSMCDLMRSLSFDLQAAICLEEALLNFCFGSRGYPWFCKFCSVW